MGHPQTQLSPSMFHRRQEQLFLNASSALKGDRSPVRNQEQQRIEKLERRSGKGTIPGAKKDLGVC